jgi:hypothetical protein
MKILGPQGVITVYGDQQTARNIERDFIPGQRSVHCLTIECEGSGSQHSAKGKKINAQPQSNDMTKIVPLNPATPKQTVMISEDLTPHDEGRLLSCLSRN